VRNHSEKLKRIAGVELAHVIPTCIIPGMSNCLVTGAAGFIGSTLAERLLAEGHQVTGVDCFVDYYAREIKEANLAALRAHPHFRFFENNLASDDLSAIVAGAEVVFHEAGQAGVRVSWGASFEGYVTNNVLASQRLLEAVKTLPLKKLILASSSSVYGDSRDLPLRESSLPQPISPYGVTKLAAEHLVNAYHVNFGLPSIALRYFTVYGPRQRPDMGFHRFIRAIAGGAPIQLYGDGNQTREATYVGDIVQANLLAMQSDANGVVVNVGGGERASVNRIIGMLEQLIEREAVIERHERQAGDVQDTQADMSRAHELLGYAPEVALYEGLRRQVEWQTKQL
jgi:nucleoside-diphosphate-sugar epimerase